MTDASSLESEEDVELGFRLASKLGGLLATKEYDLDDELELYGVSPREITILMILVTLLFPVGGIGFVYNWSNTPPLLYGVFWVTTLDNVLMAWLWYLGNPIALLQIIWMTVPLCTFNLLYIRQINRFFYGKTSRDIALFYGLLSVLVPSAISAALWTESVLPFVITPLPFQFVVGIILLYKYRDPELISPWEGYFLDLSWWTRQLYSIHEPNQKVINLTKLLMDHDADWLEEW
ncbi:MAG: hypothetical protein ACXAAO_13745 [Candidatus Thorarchaeota archaeon]